VPSAFAQRGRYGLARDYQPTFAEVSFGPDGLGMDDAKLS
jgi:hypothetical protein